VLGLQRDFPGVSFSQHRMRVFTRVKRSDVSIDGRRIAVVELAMAKPFNSSHRENPEHALIKFESMAFVLVFLRSKNPAR
jgi:hypothetical protein